MNLYSTKTFLQNLGLLSSGLLMSGSILAEKPSDVLSIHVKKSEEKVKKSSDFKTEFGFRYNEIVQDVGDVVGNQYFGRLNLDYHSESSEGTAKSFEFKSRINNEEVLEYSVKEAYIEFNSGQALSLGLGRTALTWSSLDTNWSLGKVNNRINFDYFEPEEEGLIGLFFKKRFDNGFRIDGLGSILYVPEMSQGMVINKDQGTITCKTAWCEAPESSANIEGNDVPIYYNVNYPDVSDVIYKATLGVSLGYEQGMFSGKFFHLYKPENTMTVSAQISAPADLSQINVDVTPEFYYHNVTGSEINLQLNETWSLNGAALSILPSKFPVGDQQYIEYTGIKPKKKLEQYVGAGAEFKGETLNFKLNYIGRVSDFDTESDVLVDYPRWNNAVNIYLNYMWTRNFHSMLDIKYDTLTEDRLTILKLNYLVSQGLTATLGVNMIGTDRDSESYWSKYDNNDAVYSSLKYRF